jgi:integrase
MRGNVTRRGKSSWRVKYEAGERDAQGRRKTAYATVKGTKRQAEAELTRLLATVHSGTHVGASGTTVEQFMSDWLKGLNGIEPQTLETYAHVVQVRIFPFLGHIRLQALRPHHVAEWHTLMQGRWRGTTIGFTHRLLKQALSVACTREILARNVASLVRPPKRGELAAERFLTPQQAGEILRALRGSDLYALVYTALATGARVGELCALRWDRIDLDEGSMTIDTSVADTTTLGRIVKTPKTAAGTRTISLTPESVSVLREWWTKVAEARLAVGLGRPDGNNYVFGDDDGRPASPCAISSRWIRATKRLDLPRVPFHSFRHCHASYLIAANIDPADIARRLGHSNAGVTMKIYIHASRPGRGTRQPPRPFRPPCARWFDRSGCPLGASSAPSWCFVPA